MSLESIQKTAANAVRALPDHQLLALIASAGAQAPTPSRGAKPVAVDPPPDPGRSRKKATEAKQPPTPAPKTAGRGAPRGPRDGSATPQVLEFIQGAGEVGVGDIMKGTGLPRPKVTAALKTLRANGQVEDNGGGRRDMKYLAKGKA